MVDRSDVPASRRTVLRGAGASAVALTGLPTIADRARANEDSNGMVVLIYDDSPREDYTKAFPIHQEYDVPGCVAACPGLMGTSSDWLHPDQLSEMHEAGWEVMSHTSKHRALGEIPIRSDIESGDTEIHVQSNLHGRFEGDPLVIFDDDTETTATVAGTDQDGDDDVLVLEEPIEESFEAGDGYRTWVRYTDEFTESVLEESKGQLEEWGFPVTGYVHTYDRYDGYVSEVVSEYYDAVPNMPGTGLNRTYEPDPLELSRMSFENPHTSEEELEEFLDTIANEPDFGILFGHSDMESFTPERIRTTIEMAQERDIEIVTLQEVLAEYTEFSVPDSPTDSESGGEASGDGESDGEDTDGDDTPTPAATPDGGESGSSGIGSILQWFRSRIDALLHRVPP